MCSAHKGPANTMCDFYTTDFLSYRHRYIKAESQQNLIRKLFNLINKNYFANRIKFKNLDIIVCNHSSARYRERM